RDHWAPLSTLALSGGGLRMGQVVGASSSKAEVPRTTPLTPQDLMATVFHVLGLPRDLHYNDPTGRPTPMLNGGGPLRRGAVAARGRVGRTAPAMGRGRFGLPALDPTAIHSSG